MPKIKALLKEALKNYANIEPLKTCTLKENIEVMQFYSKKQEECPYGAAIRLIRLLKSLGWKT